MSFIHSLLAMLSWSGSDFFSKAGTRNDDKNSQWKVGACVGGIMGIHALYMVFVKGIDFSLNDIWIYLPASILYIASMLIGYIGLRYIELSISSPICNGSGALALILSLFVFGVNWNNRLGDNSDAVFLNLPIVIGVVAIVIGVMSLGIVEYREDDEARLARQMKGNRRYAKSIFAIMLPVVYCILDAIGTFVDDLIAGNYLDNMLSKLYPNYESLPAEQLEEITAELELKCGDILNTAYEFTWFAMAIGCVIYLLCRREKVQAKFDLPKLAGGICETVGQVFYMMVVVSDYSVGFVIISAYCALSLVWGRLFLKERLSWKHYAAIATAFAGIMILGIYDV